MSNKAIFFDRDGVINLRYIDNYVKSTDDFVFHKDIFQILPKVKTLNYKAIVITNQRCISRGIISVSYTHLRAHETVLDLVCRLLLEKKTTTTTTQTNTHDQNLLITQ